jgi:hypothetical protein
MPLPAVASAVQLVAGVCRFCGCNGDHCRDRSGETCTWTDPSQTCCTADKCRARLGRAGIVPSPPPTKKPPRVPPFIGFCGCAVCSGRARGRCYRRFPKYSG